jgi:hypothetical protein
MEYPAVTYSTSKNMEDTAYISETAYSGAEVNPVLYDIAFSRTDQYISNIQLEETLDKDEIQQYLAAAAYDLKILYGNTYTAILEDQDSFLSAVEDISGETFYINYDSEEADMSAYETALLEAYVDSKLELSAEFETDESLLYQDSYIYYLRGSLNITMYGGDSTAFTDLYGIALEKGQTTKILCEVGFPPHNPNQIISIDLMGYLE